MITLQKATSCPWQYSDGRSGMTLGSDFCNPRVAFLERRR
jgi:hypothetical protein